jgi:aconitate hydratase
VPRATIGESFERIHRSHLIGMGVLPLQFRSGASAQWLGLTGMKTFGITGLGNAAAKTVAVTATPDSGAPIRFDSLTWLAPAHDTALARGCDPGVDARTG